MSSNPGYSTSLVQGDGGAAMAKHFYLSATAAPYTSDADSVKHVVTAFEANPAYKDIEKGFPVNFGYAQSALFIEALQRACKAGDLTRDGLHNAFLSIKNFDTGGLVGKLDYSTSGKIPARESYISKVDPAAPGGLTVVKPLFAAPEAESYTPAG
jgi:hypothetical protein